MEIYTTQDGAVSKYVHDNGAETAIKTIPGCIEFNNPLTEQKEELVDKNKYVVFISSSVGCPIGCKFCYLTSKKFPYHKLSAKQIVLNTLESIKHKIQTNPELKKKYIKLSFMGMGDAFLIINKLPAISQAIMDIVIKRGWAAGLDGIDIGTAQPLDLTNQTAAKSLSSSLLDLIYVTNRYMCNINSINKSKVRVFYSSHTFDLPLRNKLIPMNKKILPLKEAILLKNICESMYIDLIFHQIFLDNVNDGYLFTSFLNIYKANFNSNELRVLILNECENSQFKATPKDKMKRLLTNLNENINMLKIQYSAGSEIKASCGQFLMKNI